MASILTKDQVNEINKIRMLERKLNTDGWMREGADENRLVFFNNDEDKFFYTDYFGNILYRSTSFEVSHDLIKLVELEGKIAQICYMGE